MRSERAGLSGHYSQGKHRFSVVSSGVNREGWDGFRLLQVEAAAKAVHGGRREVLGPHVERAEF